MTDHLNRRLLEALCHMQICRTCADGSWTDCEEGLKALATIKVAQEEFDSASNGSSERCGGEVQAPTQTGTKEQQADSLPVPGEPVQAAASTADSLWLQGAALRAELELKRKLRADLELERKQRDRAVHDLGIAIPRIEALMEERDELKQRLDLSIQANGDLTDERDALKVEVEEEVALRERLGDLLTGVAAALKGPPTELQLHDWSDLPVLAAKLAAELAEAKQVELHSNGLLRSAYSIAARQGVQTNWNAFSAQVIAHLKAHNPSRSDVAAAPTSVQLKPGDKVTKSKGFKFPGIVVSLFTTSAGAERVVVEADHPDFAGMLHIYNPEQLEKQP